MPSSMVLTSPVLIEVDHAFGVACELLIECVELFVPPLKRYRTVYGLEDLGPLIPVGSYASDIPTVHDLTLAPLIAVNCRSGADRRR